MLTLTLYLLVLALAGSDVAFSNRRIRLYGPKVEANPLARSAYGKWGLPGLTLAIMWPSLVVASVLAFLGADIPQAWFLGIRSCLLGMQLKSIDLENDPKFREYLDSLR